MAAKFSMVNTSGLFDTAAHVEASDRMHDAMEELKIKHERQDRFQERQRVASERKSAEQKARLQRAREAARANAAGGSEGFIRAKKPNENQGSDAENEPFSDDEEDDNDDFEDDGFGLPSGALLGAKKREEEDDDDDDALLDELDQDPELERLRARRLAQLKTQFEQKQALLAKGHGELREIAQDEFLKEVTASARVLVHFYHRDFERCKILDMHLARLATRHIECKFLKINAEKSPFFVEKLVVRVLPTLVGFADGVAFPERLIGFDGLTDDEDGDDEAFGSRANYRAKSSDSFPTSALARKLVSMGVITYSDADEDDENEAK